MLRVAVTGSTGLVGARVAALLQGEAEILPLGRRSGFDLSNATIGESQRACKGVDAILHLAACTDVDGIEAERAEGETGNAWKVNVGGTRNLTIAAARLGIPLVFVSTDFVFPARAEGPYPEAPAPTQESTETSWYGWTKLMAEKEVLGEKQNAVVRIAYPYVASHPTRVDHARRILQLRREKKLYPLYDDQWFTPTYVDDLARSLNQILRKTETGIFHVASTDRVTPLVFATELLRAVGDDPKDLKSAKFPTEPASGKAVRPQRGGLDVKRSKAAGLKVQPVKVSLRDFAAKFGAH